MTTDEEYRYNKESLDSKLTYIIVSLQQLSKDVCEDKEKHEATHKKYNRWLYLITAVLAVQVFSDPALLEMSVAAIKTILVKSAFAGG